MKIIVKGQEYELEELHISGNKSEDREVTVTSVAADSHMRVYTSDDVWLTKIKKCVAANPKDWQIVSLMFHKDGTLSGVTAECPKRCLSLRTGVEAHRIKTPEEQEARLKALEKARLVKDDSERCF